MISIDSNIEKTNEKMNKNNNNCHELSSNSLISNSLLHILIPYPRVSPKDMQIIKENNLKVMNAKFTKSEDKILTNNWNLFCNEFNINEDMKTRLLGFFARSKKYSQKDRKEVRDFMRRENFFLRLANGLPNRMIKTIYYRARVLFNTLKRFKDITDNERKLMKSLHSIHKNKWTIIAENINCYPLCVQTEIESNYNSNGETFKKGKWSTKEEKKFIKALKIVLNTNDLSDKIFAKNIHFIKVRDLAKLNRSYTDCRHHWMDCLRWKLTNFNQLEGKWSKSDSSKLIYFLFKSNYDNECHIDWDFIKEKFTNISSFNNLMKNWRIIKSTVPEFETKTYKQIINFLYDNFLPNFIKTDSDLKELEDFYQN